MSFETPGEDRITVDTPEQISLEFPLAGIGSRFLAIALDTLLQFVLYVAAFFAMIGLSEVSRFLPNWFSWAPASWGPALLILFVFCIYWGYFAGFEILWKGQTPGKKAASIRAIKNTGRALNVYEVIGRNLLRTVDWLPGMYVAGMVSIMVSRQNQRLGDHLVGSIVVHDKRADEIRPEWSHDTGVSVAPQIAGITSEEVVLIETYLLRRLSLDFAIRDATAHQIASRITAKTGIQREPHQSLDEFLESIARQARNSSRFH